MLVNPKYTSESPTASLAAKAPENQTKQGRALRKPMPREVSCVNFRGLISYLRKTYGEKAVFEVFGEFIENPEYLLADKYNPGSGVLIKLEHLTDPSYWISYDLALRIMNNVRKVVNDPDPLFAAGKGAVKESLSKSVFFVARILGPRLILKRAQKFNSRFNRTKELELMEVGDDHVVLRFKYYPGFEASKGMCDWHRGIYTGVLGFAGFKQVEIKEISCRTRGDRDCIFHVSWRPQGILVSALKAVIKSSLQWAIGDLVAEYDQSVRDRDALIEKLTESEHRYRSVFESSATPTIIVEEDLTISMANTEFEKLSGYSKEEIEGSLTLGAFFEGGIARSILEQTEEERGQEDFLKREFGFLDKQGTRKDVIVKVGKITGAQRYVCSLVDITSRKRVEKTLRKSEEKHRTIIQSIEEGYFETDLAGRFTYVNDSLCRILGKPRKELIGTSYRTFVTQETAEAIYQSFNRVYRTGRPVKVAEYEFSREDGTKLFIGLSATLIRNQEEKVIGFRGMLRDVTEREKAKEEKRRLEARLEQAKRMEAIGTLAGGVAHDLNNILSGVVSYPDLLLMQLPPDSPMRKPLKTIQETGEKAATIVQDLLTLARRGVAVTEVVNLNKIIKDYLSSPEFEKLKAYHPAVEVITRLDKELLNLKGSPVHLSKTVMNLVSNGAEAMPDGGTLTITTENQYLEKPLPGSELEPGEYVVLRVTDTGIGMSEEEKERIFEPFYTKKVMGRSGTGLGMAVVWGTVQDHHGHIQIETAKGKGTTFTLYFPATREEISKEEKHLSIDEYMGKGETVLVVDDIKEQREIASAILRKLNYKVYTVPSGEEAVKYMKEHSADILLLDMIMDPGMDGLETYEKIIKIHPGQKAILVSGFSESDRVKKAQRLGAGTYIKKPYSMERLGIALRRILDSPVG
ncbi:MAG: hypothetical protein DRH12_10595 [Deltaproteobacteria bacterium]|nr:MAG: hypothetical protein DRH12_10595 [Deltaproteobacteria bacterium]